MTMLRQAKHVKGGLVILIETEGHKAATFDFLGFPHYIPQLSDSEAVIGGSVCRKAARTGLWGSGEAKKRPAGKFNYC